MYYALLPTAMNKPYIQYKDYMRERYGEPLFRVPIDFNLGCPNRESDGSGGCTFCNVRGSAAVQTIGKDSVQEQMAEAIRFARDRYGAKKYMAYIQAFSATFGESQQPMYLDLLDSFDFTAVSIGTRSDCLTPQAYDFLVELNKHIEVWVELGVQTVHDRTLERVNRGHDWASSEEAIIKLHRLGIKVAAHVILGLPGETAKDFQQTADTLAALPIDAVKIHNLHIEKGTTLALEHALIPLPVFMEHDFAEHLMDFIRRLPADMPIMRLTTDTLDEELIAPKWNMGKGQFKDYVIQQMTCREWQQGDLFENGRKRDGETESVLKIVETEDGSITFWNQDYKEHYHTPAGARLEAVEKYLVPGKLKERLAKGDVQLLDVCFGLGYNSLVAMDMTIGGMAASPSSGAEASAPPTLQITALEMDQRVVGAAAKNIQPLKTDSYDWKLALQDLYENHSCLVPNASCLMHWGDARYTVTHLPNASFDLVFLDAFSTQRNSELWTLDFFQKLKSVMKPDAVLLTYCAAIPVRSAMLEAGFFVGETKPIGRQRGGTIAAMRSEDIEIPLPDDELEKIRDTTRGLPYRDPYGVWTNKEILRDRQERILHVKASSTA
ncbi:MAG: TIGR01212 family radical SAM protein [Pontiella sp.]